ncbi:MAG: hypothetical protein HZA84_05250 [Thaumarchaeota archaeon]|nr:hypothetical protein [Nitrososphaerota archaeon]
MKSLKAWLGNDIFRCLNCGRFAIAEEKDLHECRGLKQHKVEGDIFRAFDGYSWYPLKWDQVRPTEFDREKYRRRLDRTNK